MRGKSTRWFLLSLSLAVIVAVLGYAWSIHHRQEHLKALRLEVLGWGGQVNRYPNSNKAWDPLRRLIGQDRVDSIVGYDGYSVEGPMNGPMTEKQLAQLLVFRPILDYRGSAESVGDDWIAGIRDPSAVQRLSLSCAQKVTDRSLPQFLEMGRLQQLSVEYTDLSDDSIVRLRQLPQLRRLDFGGRNVKSVRLLEVWTADSHGLPADRAEQATSLRGRLAIDPKIGRFSKIEIMAYGSKGPGGGRCRPANLAEDSPGIFSFDVKVEKFRPGEFDVWITLISDPAFRLMRMTCRLHHGPIQLKAGEEVEGLAKSDRIR